MRSFQICLANAVFFLISPHFFILVIVIGPISSLNTVGIYPKGICMIYFSGTYLQKYAFMHVGCLQSSGFFAIMMLSLLNIYLCLYLELQTIIRCRFAFVRVCQVLIHVQRIENKLYECHRDLGKRKEKRTDLHIVEVFRSLNWLLRK